MKYSFWHAVLTFHSVSQSLDPWQDAAAQDGAVQPSNRDAFIQLATVDAAGHVNMVKSEAYRERNKHSSTAVGQMARDRESIATSSEPDSNGPAGSKLTRRGKISEAKLSGTTVDKEKTESSLVSASSNMPRSASEPQAAIANVFFARARSNEKVILLSLAVLVVLAVVAILCLRRSKRVNMDDLQVSIIDRTASINQLEEASSSSDGPDGNDLYESALRSTDVAPTILRSGFIWKLRMDRIESYDQIAWVEAFLDKGSLQGIELPVEMC
jgi:hypothetical protein